MRNQECSKNGGFRDWRFPILIGSKPLTLELNKFLIGTTTPTEA